MERNRGVLYATLKEWIRIKLLIFSLFALFSFSASMLYATSEKGNVSENKLQEQIEKYKSEPPYNYFEQQQKTPVKEKESSSFSMPSIVGDVVMYILIAAFIVTVFIVAFSILKDGGGKVSKDKKIAVSNAAFENLNEDEIDANDFDGLIDKAQGLRDYRMILRLLFLKSLQLLNDRKMIHYKKNKTNYEYSFEIKKKEVKNDFIHVSDLFSWIWYGNKVIDVETFKKLEPAFLNFIARIDK